MLKLIVLLLFKSYADCNVTVEVTQLNRVVARVWVTGSGREKKIIEVPVDNEPLKFFVKGENCKFPNYKIQDGILIGGKTELYIEIGPQPYMSQVR